MAAQAEDRLKIQVYTTLEVLDDDDRVLAAATRCTHALSWKALHAIVVESLTDQVTSVRAELETTGVLCAQALKEE